MKVRQLVCQEKHSPLQGLTAISCSSQSLQRRCSLVVVTSRGSCCKASWHMRFTDVRTYATTHLYFKAACIELSTACSIAGYCAGPAKPEDSAKTVPYICKSVVWICAWLPAPKHKHAGERYRCQRQSKRFLLNLELLCQLCTFCREGVYVSHVSLWQYK